MFKTKKQIMELAKDIILDDTDNDIIFIVANKGGGKTEIMKEIKKIHSEHPNTIITSTERSDSNLSPLATALSQGINQYCTSRKKKKPHTSVSLEKTLLEDLKEKYYKVAGNTPLVVFSFLDVLVDGDLKYLEEMHKKEKFKARVTYIFAVRPNESDIDKLKKIVEKVNRDTRLTYGKRLHLMVVLPDISKDCHYIKIGDNDKCSINDIFDLYNSDPNYYELFSFYARVSDLGFNPLDLLFFANSDVTHETYDTMERELRYLKITPGLVYKQYITQNDRHYYFLDPFLCFFLANNEDDLKKAKQAAQHFYFLLLTNYNDIAKKGKDNENALFRMLDVIKTTKPNEVSSNFGIFYKQFAASIKHLIEKQKNQSNPSFVFESCENEIDELCRLLQSDANFDSNYFPFDELYKLTQSATILNIGLMIIVHDFDMIIEQDYPMIKSYINLCITVAIKWNDLTLLKESIDIAYRLKTKTSYKITFTEKFEDAFKNNLSQNDAVQLLSSHYGGLFMTGPVFISHTQSEKGFAEELGKKLIESYYDVILDSFNLKRNDDIKKFMKQISKSELVIILLSDAYMKSYNCIYELTQLVTKSNNYYSKTYVVAKPEPGINFFDISYSVEIEKYWIEARKDFVNKTQDLPPEYQNHQEEHRLLMGAPNVVSDFLKDVGSHLIVSEAQIKDIGDCRNQKERDELYQKTIVEEINNLMTKKHILDSNE